MLPHNYTGYPLVRQAREMIAEGALKRRGAEQCQTTFCQRFNMGWKGSRSSTPVCARQTVTLRGYPNLELMERVVRDIENLWSAGMTKGFLDIVPATPLLLVKVGWLDAKLDQPPACKDRHFPHRLSKLNC